MSMVSIPVDLFNPGQVFASLGFMELAEVLCGEVEAGFDWSDPSVTRFVLRVPGEVDPIAAALGFLAEATLHSMAPAGSDLSTDKWSVATEETTGGAFPIRLPGTPATLPAVLRANGREIVLSSWGEGNVPNALPVGRDNVKFWAGAGGYPGVGLLRDSLDASRHALRTAKDDPFTVSMAQSSSFRFDWRRDYIPIDIGFSLNNHGKGIEPRGYPLVEIFAAIGISHARPFRPSWRNKLEYRYGVAGRSNPDSDEMSALLPPPLLRAALGAASLPFPSRIFTMNLGWPGKEGQARCITTVLEETIG